LRRFLAAVFLALACGVAAAEAPVIAAAADLRFALEEIARNFERERGRALRLSFGSSGNFRQQISAGAPFQLFLSADEDYVIALHREGRTEDAGVLYAVGRIVLFAAKGSPVTPDAGMKDLARALRSGQVRRFAIANPEHAPYGRAAREALESLGLWSSVRERLVFGESVSQAAQFAASPDAQAGIIAYSLALAPQVARLGSYVLLPETLHSPLRQRMALVRGAGPTAREFYRYLQEPAAREVLQRSGFVLPGD
jgi:molybdate transport system substrate-binding protein